MIYGIGQTEKPPYSDVLGATASGLCAIHCALTPVFFATRPVLESTIDKHSHGSGFWALLIIFF